MTSQEESRIVDTTSAEQIILFGSSKIAPQTRIMMIGVFLLVIAQIVALLLKSTALSAFDIVGVIGNIVVYMVALYVINCVVIGKCNLYAWIMGYVMAILGILTTAFITIQIFKYR